MAVLTPARVQLFQFLAECRFLSLPQLALLISASPKSTRRHMRMLFDAGLVKVVPVSRLALADSSQPNDASLLYGSAPNLYVPTSQGLDLLIEANLIDRSCKGRTTPGFGPKNSLFLAHELKVRDVRVWLELTAKKSGPPHEILRWEDGSEATMNVSSDVRVNPDAWFIYRFGASPTGSPSVLVSMVEVDRNTERGDFRWRQKLEAYANLFATGCLAEVTGYKHARVLVLTSSEQRSDRLIALIEGLATPELAQRFWMATSATVEVSNLTTHCWRSPCNSGWWPLIPSSLLQLASES